MTLTFLDWIVIAAYFLLNLAIGLYYARRARGSTTDFFLSGRDVPWWLAGTSMVATTFAADTPLVVTGLVARYGIAGNWLWWSMAASGMLTVFVYARLWRRSGVMTDVELAELRYAGKPAAFLRVPARKRGHVHRVIAHIVKFRINSRVRQATEKRNDAFCLRITPQVFLCEMQCDVVASRIRRREFDPAAGKNLQIVQTRFRSKQGFTRQDLRRIESQRAIAELFVQLQ